MEDYKSITNYLKLDKYFIDENSKINFKYIYEDIIPKFKSLESKEKEILRISKDIYFIQIYKKKIFIFAILNYSKIRNI